MDIILGETKCLFTAMTVFAAALLGGVTLHSAALVHQNQKKDSHEMMKMWDQVRMPIIYEILFSTKDQKAKLNT